MSWVGSFKPSNLIYLLLYFQTLEVIKLWFMALEGAVYIVFSKVGILSNEIAYRKHNQGDGTYISYSINILLVLVEK